MRSLATASILSKVNTRWSRPLGCRHHGCDRQFGGASVCSRPPVSYIATAFRLGFSVNRRLVVLTIIHFVAPQSISSVFVKPRDDNWFQSRGSDP